MESLFNWRGNNSILYAKDLFLVAGYNQKAIKGQGGYSGYERKDIYDLKYYKDIKKYCEDKNISLYDYVLENEDSDFVNFLKRVWEVMKASVETGLTKEGIIPGKLKLDRRSKFIYESNIFFTKNGIFWFERQMFLMNFYLHIEKKVLKYYVVISSANY